MAHYLNSLRTAYLIDQEHAYLSYFYVDNEESKRYAYDIAWNWDPETRTYALSYCYAHDWWTDSGNSYALYDFRDSVSYWVQGYVDESTLYESYLPTTYALTSYWRPYVDAVTVRDAYMGCGRNADGTTAYVSIARSLDNETIRNSYAAYIPVASEGNWGVTAIGYDGAGYWNCGTAFDAYLGYLMYDQFEYDGKVRRAHYADYSAWSYGIVPSDGRLDFHSFTYDRLDGLESRAHYAYDFVLEHEKNSHPTAYGTDADYCVYTGVSGYTYIPVPGFVRNDAGHIVDAYTYTLAVKMPSPGTDGFVPETRMIAGITLESDIPAEALAEALREEAVLSLENASGSGKRASGRIVLDNTHPEAPVHIGGTWDESMRGEINLSVDMTDPERPLLNAYWCGKDIYKIADIEPTQKDSGKGVSLHIHSLSDSYGGRIGVEVKNAYFRDGGFDEYAYLTTGADVVNYFAYHGGNAADKYDKVPVDPGQNFGEFLTINGKGGVEISKGYGPGLYFDSDMGHMRLSDSMIGCHASHKGSTDIPTSHAVILADIDSDGIITFAGRPEEGRFVTVVLHNTSAEGPVNLVMGINDNYENIGGKSFRLGIDRYTMVRLFTMLDRTYVWSETGSGIITDDWLETHMNDKVPSERLVYDSLSDLEQKAAVAISYVYNRRLRDWQDVPDDDHWASEKLVKSEIDEIKRNLDDLEQDTAELTAYLDIRKLDKEEFEKYKAAFSSDISLKKDIARIDDADIALKALNGYKFVWNESAEKTGLSGRSVGVIAQEVEKVIPEAVGVLNGKKTVDCAKLVPFLIEGWKQDHARIESLEKRIEELERCIRSK